MYVFLHLFSYLIIHQHINSKKFKKKKKKIKKKIKFINKKIK